MLGEDHSLALEFPDLEDQILEMRTSSPEFGEKFERYHELDKKIRTLELTKVPTDDQHFIDLKLERVQLKDQLYNMLR